VTPFNRVLCLEEKFFSNNFFTIFFVYIVYVGQLRCISSIRLALIALFHLQVNGINQAWVLRQADSFTEVIHRGLI
jgi:hypothetical protein